MSGYMYAHAISANVISTKSPRRLATFTPSSRNDPGKYSR